MAQQKPYDIAHQLARAIIDDLSYKEYSKQKIKSNKNQNKKKIIAFRAKQLKLN